MSLHPAIVSIIHRSGLKGGLGLIANPGYWSGMPADSAYLSGRNLFRLWQEVFLLEQAGELPPMSAEYLSEMIVNIKLLRPDQFFGNLHRWAEMGYGRVPIAEEIHGNHEQIVLGMLCGRFQNEARERDVSIRAKVEFYQLRDRCLGRENF